MKLLVNLSSILIMLLSFSTITSAQGQQRPSQRSFATVLSKIKEKKSGRDKMHQERNQQPEEKVERIVDPETGTGTPTNVVKPIAPGNTNTVPTQPPSRQNLLLRRKPNG